MQLYIILDTKLPDSGGPKALKTNDSWEPKNSVDLFGFKKWAPTRFQFFNLSSNWKPWPAFDVNDFSNGVKNGGKTNRSSLKLILKICFLIKGGSLVGWGEVRERA